LEKEKLQISSTFIEWSAGQFFDFINNMIFLDFINFYSSGI